MDARQVQLVARIIGARRVRNVQVLTLQSVVRTRLIERELVSIVRGNR